MFTPSNLNIFFAKPYIKEKRQSAQFTALCLFVF